MECFLNPFFLVFLGGRAIHYTGAISRIHVPLKAIYNMSCRLPSQLAIWPNVFMLAPTRAM